MTGRPCCSVGAREDAEAIDAALARVGQEGAESLSAIAARIEINKGTLYRHRVKCLGLGGQETAEATPEPPPESPKRAAQRPEQRSATGEKRSDQRPATETMASGAEPAPSPRTVGALRSGPGRRCTICDHPERPAIDEALVGATVSFRAIASRYGVDDAAAWRHSRAHIPAILAMAREGEVVAAAESLLEIVPELIDRGHRMFGEAEDILQQAKDAKDLDVAIKAIRAANDSIGRLVGAAELLGKVTGELKAQTTTVNILTMPQFVAFQQRVVAVVARHPEAAAELRAELAALEGAPA